MRNVISSNYDPKSYPGFMEGGDGKSAWSLMGGQEKCFEKGDFQLILGVAISVQFVTEIF